MRSVLAATLGTASAGLLRISINNNTLSKTLGVDGGVNYGNGKCQCVGFDNVGGTTKVIGPGDKTFDMPADLGARCEAWEENKHPSCKGSNPESWCSQAWCYVDPCDCDIATIPKVSSYLPDAKYQGKPVYYSYETCGGKDSYTTKHHKTACVNQATKDECSAQAKCLWHEGKCGGKDVMGYCKKPLPVNIWGENNCRCVGIDGQPGTMEVRVGTEKEVTMEYPADLGATCDAWDMGRHPECSGPKVEPWCNDRWCYVDPCTCDHDIPPTGSNYMPESTFQGKQIFYSYATCGTENRYSATHRKRALKKQAEVCYASAWKFTPVVALLLSFLSL